MSTKIEWTDETWNPLVGCSRTSPGCDHCYAIGVARRGLSPQHRGLTVRTASGTDWTGEVRFVPEMLDRPLKWRKPRKVFVNSLSDLFHRDVSSHDIAAIFRVMARTPQHTYQVLTKRPQRMRAWVEANNEITVPTLPNVWLGTSIESDQYTFRADHLRATPAAVRWISAEPLLGPLPSLDLTGIDWVVVGGESGPGARPMHPDWARDIRDRCVAAGVPFLFKQWGEWLPEGQTIASPPSKASFWTRQHLTYDGDDRYAPNEGRSVPVRRVGKRLAGRELDGHTWDEYPA